MAKHSCDLCHVQHTSFSKLCRYWPKRRYKSWTVFRIRVSCSSPLVYVRISLPSTQNTSFLVSGIPYLSDLAQYFQLHNRTQIKNWHVTNRCRTRVPVPGLEVSFLSQTRTQTLYLLTNEFLSSTLRSTFSMFTWVRSSFLTIFDNSKIYTNIH